MKKMARDGGEAVWRRLPRRFLAVGAFVLGSFGVALASAQAAEDQQVELSIVNSSQATMKCVVLFGHWVTQDLPLIASGGQVPVKLIRAAKDGALYIPRFDGRKMMVERIACGRAEAWWDTIGDVPLLPLREKAMERVKSACHLEQRAVCSAPVVLQNDQG